MRKNIVVFSALTSLIASVSALADMDLKTCSDNGYMSEVSNDMRWYRVNNSSFHAGDDLNDHSAWSALAMEQWFEQGHNWVKDIPANLKDAAILGAFLHDVGKSGDLDQQSLLYPGWKAPHPKDGFDFSIGAKVYRTLKGDATARAQFEKVDLVSLQPQGSSYRGADGQWISVPMTDDLKAFIERLEKAANGGTVRSFDKLLRACPMSDREAAMIKISIGMHYDWGNFIADKPTNPPEVGYQQYLDSLFKHIKATGSEALFNSRGKVAELIHFCIAVANADFKGSQPVNFTSQRFPLANDNITTMHKLLVPTPYEKWNGDANFELRKVPFMEWYANKKVNFTP